MGELIIGSGTDEIEKNSSIKMTHQENNDEVLYLFRAWKGRGRSRLVIKKNNDMKMKLGSKIMLSKSGKTKVDSEPPAKTASSAKWKKVEGAVDMGQGDDRLHDTSKKMTDLAIVSTILMAGLRTASFKTERSDPTLTGATLALEILSQGGERTLRDFKSSNVKQGKVSVAGQLTLVEHYRMTVPETMTIDEPWR